MNTKILYYLIAFFEGMLVMSVELIAARLLAPFYGSSIYPLTAILGITMLALLSGYYFGGRLVAKNVSTAYAMIFVIVAGAVLCLMPSYSSKLLQLTLSLGIVGGSIVATIVLIYFPLMLLGAVSPILIQKISEFDTKAGTASGNVYAISTLGGVIGTFIIGILCIPNFGVKFSAIFFGIICSLFPVITLLFFFRNRTAFSTIIFLLFGLSLGMWHEYNPIPAYANCEYQSDGLMGRIDVCDQSGNRILSNNGTAQTSMILADGVSMMVYTHVITTVASLVKPEKRNKAVLIGLAGGTLVKELSELGYGKIYAVDIDARTQFVSDKYFGLNPNSYTFIEDDGRHFLQTSNEYFDVIIVDVSTSEQQPYHLFTIEAMQLYRKRLNVGGLLIFNIIDFDTHNGTIVEKITDGMFTAGMETRILKEFYPLNKMNSNEFTTHIHERIIVGNLGNLTNLSVSLDEMNECCRKLNYNRYLKENFFNTSFIKNNADTKGFRDDKPEMEKLSFKRIKLLRNEKFIY